MVHTGKSMTEALIFASTNPQYDNRLFIELPLQCMKIPSSEHKKNMLCTQIVFCFDFKNNLGCIVSELIYIYIYNYVKDTDSVLQWGEHVVHTNCFLF